MLNTWTVLMKYLEMIWKYDDPELFKNMSTSSPLDSKKSGGNPAMAGVFIPSDSPKLVSQLDVHESYVPQNEPFDHGT